jgi:hypothetical protein
MRQKPFIVVVAIPAILAGALCFLSATAAKESKQQPPKIPQKGQDIEKEMQQMKNEWQTYMTPGEYHKRFVKEVGTWTAEGKAWMMPGQEPQTATATVENKLILGGRYLYSEHHGTMFGEPFEGIGIYAYDNHLKEYVAVWIDNAGTGVYEMRARSASPDSKVLTYTGVWDDPIEGGKTKVRSVETWVNDNQYTFEMFMTGPDGTEFKSMDLTYTRKQ